ncbi:PAS domain S-box protein [Aeribacillus pallidus]|nr:PAS domain S-box protein [Aeribacillus pallidus]
MIFAFVQKEKNKLERKLETTNLYYESLITYNPYIVFIINIDGMITNINPKGLEILKAKKEQMIHQSIFSFLPQDDAERVKQKMNRLLEHNENEMEVSFKNSKGEWIPLLLTFVPMIYKTHRSYIVNLKKIIKIEPQGETYAAHFSGSDKVAYISKLKIQEVHGLLRA